MAENRGQIKILRANNVTDGNVKDIILQDGQPFYDKETKHLYIGEGNSIANSTPIMTGNNDTVFYCESSADATIKQVTVENYNFINNQRAFIIFKNGNSSESMQLKINDRAEIDLEYSLTSSSPNIFGGVYSGRYMFRDDMSVGGTYTYNFPFKYTTNGTDIVSANSITISYNASSKQTTIKYDNTTVYSTVWYNSFYKFIIVDNITENFPYNYVTKLIDSNTLYSLHYDNNFNKWVIDDINVTNSLYAQYASSDISKGTIEERLTNLGFKSGSITFNDDAAQYIDIENSFFELKRQGNYVIGKFEIGLTSEFIDGIRATSSGTITVKIGKVGEEFKPKDNDVYASQAMNLSIMRANASGFYSFQSSIGLKVTTDSEVFVTFELSNTLSSDLIKAMSNLYPLSRLSYYSYNVIGYEAITL